MIVVPDDFPSVFEGSEGHQRARRLDEVRVFTERGADQEAELIRRVGNAEVVVNIRAYARFTDRVLAACPRLRLVSIWGTGVDNVDLEACRRHGVYVTNTPGVNADAVAEHTIALMLAVTRKIIDEHGGRISVTSRPRQGTTFVLVLPLSRTAEADPADTRQPRAQPAEEEF